MRAPGGRLRIALRKAVALALATGLTASLVATHCVLAGDPVDFVPVPGWPQLGDLKLGQTSAVAADRDGSVYVFHRGEHPILCFGPEGKLLRYWGDGLIGKAHGLRIDGHGNIWITDIGRHVVRKLATDGQVLMTLGTENHPGLSPTQFNQPTDIAFGPHDEVYVTDGYGNSRVVKFAADGRYLKSWGKPGSGPGEFNLPHSVVLDSKGRVIVADRENNRIQVFDSEGKLLEIWPGFAPFGLAITPDDVLYVADGHAHKVLRLDRHGKVVQSWGEQGSAPGQFDLPHMLALDRDGNLYVTEITGQRVQKLRRK